MSGEGEILIVEDDPVIRSTMRLVLEREGLTIREAEDGEQAMALATERVPDLVFLDLTLPGLDGLDVLRQLKADPEAKAAQVVIVSMRADGRDEALEAGADEFFVKPFSPLALLRLVDKLLPSWEPGSTTPRTSRDHSP
ncbi:MAG: response regulator [Actinomycetota bacterium]